MNKMIGTSHYMDAILAISYKLHDFGIPHKVQVNSLLNGFGITFPWCRGDVACNDWTYGHARGLVETYRFPWDEDDVTSFFPDEAFQLIKAYYLSLQQPTTKKN